MKGRNGLSTNRGYRPTSRRPGRGERRYTLKKEAGSTQPWAYYTPDEDPSQSGKVCSQLCSRPCYPGCMPCQPATQEGVKGTRSRSRYGMVDRSKRDRNRWRLVGHSRTQAECLRRKGGGKFQKQSHHSCLPHGYGKTTTPTHRLSQSLRKRRGHRNSLAGLEDCGR